MGLGPIVMLQKVMPYQLEIKEEKEKTKVLCINVPSMRGKRKDTGFILRVPTPTIYIFLISNSP